MNNTSLKKTPVIITALLLLCFTSHMLAQLASWSPAGLSSYGPTPWAATASNVNLTVGGLTRGAGIGTGGTPAANGWGGTTWQGASNQDATFTITANPGFSVSYSTFNLSYRRSTTGPNAGTLEYTFGSSTTYTVISTINNFTSTATTGVLITPINLSGVANLQNVPAGTVIKFRIFPTGGTSPAGTWYVLGTGGMSINGTVTASSVYSVSIAKTASISCNGQAGAALTASVSGGTAPYTYSWSPGGGSSATASGLSAGVYTCVVTSASSATTMSTYTVTEPSALSPVLSSQSNVTCAGDANGAATVSVTGGTAPYTYSWSPGGGTSAAANGLAGGAYTLTIGDANNCIQTQTISISEPVALSPTVSAQNNVTCHGGADGSAMVSVAGGAAPYTYTWSPAGGNASLAAGLGAGTYTLGIMDANGCTASQTVSLTEPASLPNVSANASSTLICSGSTVTLSGAGANTYTWTSGVTDGVAFSPGTTATYTVYGTDANGCNGSAVTGITVNPLPAINVITSPSSTVCNGNPVTLSGSGASTYTWTGGVSDGIAFTPTASAAYTVTGTDLNGCMNNSIAYIAVNNLPTVTTSATSSSICIGGNTTLNGGGASTYTWTGGVTNGTAFTPTASTSYTVTGTDVNGCSNTATQSITVNSLPAVTASATNTSVCAVTPVTLNANGASTYTWTGGVTNGTAFTPTASASYTVTGTDINGCTGTDVTTIVVNPLPSVVPSALPSFTICTGNSVMLSGSGASTYTWTGGVTNGATFTPTASASYTVTGTDINGCANSATCFITVSNLPTVTASATNPTLCIGGGTTLNGGGASTYTWSGGATNGVAFAPPVSANYTVTGTDANGCINTATTSVAVYLLPGVQANTSATVICAGQMVTLTATGAATYSWSTAQTGPVITANPTAGTTYTVRGTDVHGCSNTASVVQNVSVCTGLEEWQPLAIEIKSYPNPNDGTFTVVSNADIHVSLVNSVGELVGSLELNSQNNRQAILEGLSSGLYVLTGQGVAGTIQQKIIVTK